VAALAPGALYATQTPEDGAVQLNERQAELEGPVLTRSLPRHFGFHIHHPESLVKPVAPVAVDHVTQTFAPGTTKSFDGPRPGNFGLHQTRRARIFYFVGIC
jgi:hypothetical protein